MMRYCRPKNLQKSWPRKKYRTNHLERDKIFSRSSHTRTNEKLMVLQKDKMVGPITKSVAKSVRIKTIAPARPATSQLLEATNQSKVSLEEVTSRIASIKSVITRTILPKSSAI